MPCENLLTRFLLQNKAERMQQIQRQLNVRLQASKGSLVVKGEKDAVAQAVAKVEALKAELAKRTVDMEVNGAQVEAEVGTLMAPRWATSPTAFARSVILPPPTPTISSQPASWALAASSSAPS